ncbi:Uncharacterised protein [Vibrio cholerae]|uniref:Uncharacterized protein n=1 Tax=Vibrio cholerae TaxID=666 RepID=A0A655YC92_VIBCL|nr:Uncharacterised protein [Vibrio cholerae]CSB78919.1 Uncharacterised protein [Vibrio cholerae]CSC00638.1 Uncharacterised protein [Vibrio cholerae]CSC30509.1 Uncharacterised protein [Vibrio cholerae]CSC34609.1 Uncharacterised protein [Vibrio cholerae]
MASSTNKLVTPEQALLTTKRVCGLFSIMAEQRLMASKLATLVPPNLATLNVLTAILPDFLKNELLVTQRPML